MKFKADEISSVIQREIEQFSPEITRTEVGQVLEVGDGIAGASSNQSGSRRIPGWYSNVFKVLCRILGVYYP